MTRIMGAILAALVVMPLSPRADLKNEQGSLAARVEEVARGQFGEGTNLFRPASAEERQIWKAAVHAILNHQLEEAQRILMTLPFPYELRLFVDMTTEREYVLLQEKSPIQAGWGMYVFDLKSPSSLVVEVPHPRSDLRTENEGIDIFLATRAFAFLLAGSHRRANLAESPCDTRSLCGTESESGARYKESDAAHSIVTMFQATHEAIASERPTSVAVSIHGMSERAACPNLFLSSGAANATEVTRRLLSCLIQQGVEAGLYTGECEGCLMAGTTNIQGRFSNNPEKDPCTTAAFVAPEPGRFIHIEQEPVLRRDATAWQPVVEAFKCAFPISGQP